MPTVVMPAPAGRQYVSRLFRPEGVQRGGDGGVVGGQQGGGEQRRIGRAGGTDRKRRHRNASRHLHDRQQRVEPVQRLRLHRHAEHRHPGLAGDHARQVGGAAGASDDGAETARLGAFGEGEQQVRGAVGGDHLDMRGDPQRGEALFGVTQGVPVGARAHHDGDARRAAVLGHASLPRETRIVGTNLR
jgi:hypothetical protein